MSQKNKVLITGANSGIGRSLVSYLVENRYDVIALARNLDEVETHEKIFKYQVDLTDIPSLDKVLASIVKEHGYVANIINNAGVMQSGEFNELSYKHLENSFKVNAFAPFQIMKSFLPLMQRENYGRIINVTSGAPLNCFSGYGAYSSSKAALNAFSETIANEVKDYDIKIMLMSPGPCKTKMAPDGKMDPSACHDTVNYLLNLTKDEDTKGMFWLGHQIPLKPSLKNINWAEGTAYEGYKIL